MPARRTVSARNVAAATPLLRLQLESDMLGTETKQLHKYWIFVLCAVSLTVLGIALQPADCKGTDELHTLMEL